MRSASPTTSRTACPATCGARTSAARTAWPQRTRPACASSTARTCAICANRSAAPRPAASGARAAAGATRCSSSRRMSRSPSVVTTFHTGAFDMGKLALAAKITHVPSLYLSELDGPHKGCRQAAIDGHKEIGRRCRELGVDTIVVFDVHWLVNSEYHINCAPTFKGVYTSNELPHFISNMPYEYPGNPGLGRLIAEVANESGVKTRAHSETTLEIEYGTLVPMRYMNADQ